MYTHICVLPPFQVKPPDLQNTLKNRDPVLEGQTHNIIFKINGYSHTINHPVYFWRSSVSTI